MQRGSGPSEFPRNLKTFPWDKLAAQFGFDVRGQKGLNTVETCARVLVLGSSKAFIGLGGNFVGAIPERERMERAWTKMRLTVQIASELNHSHLVNGEVAYLLPCLDQPKEDLRAIGPQAVSMEDTFSHIVGSIRSAQAGERAPAFRGRDRGWIGYGHLTAKSETELVNSRVGNYALIREQIEKTYSQMFHGYDNKRMWQPGGFYKGNKARGAILEDTDMQSGIHHAQVSECYWLRGTHPAATG